MGNVPAQLRRWEGNAKAFEAAKSEVGRVAPKREVVAERAAALERLAKVQKWQAAVREW